MDVAIIAALIGAVGSIVAAVVGAALARRGGTTERPRHWPEPAGRHPPPIGFGQRLLLAVGGFFFFMGFALFGYVVIAFMTTVFASFQSPSPPDLSEIPFMPFVPFGLGLMFVGIVILSFTALTRSQR